MLVSCRLRRDVLMAGFACAAAAVHMPLPMLQWIRALVLPRNCRCSAASVFHGAQFQCYCEKIWYGVVRCRMVDAQDLAFPIDW